MKKLFTIALIIFSFDYINAQDGLVAYYPFNEDAKDKSGNSYDLTVSGATLTNDRNDVADAAYAFDGSSSKITGTIDLNGATTITMSAWIKSTQSGLGFYVYYGSIALFTSTNQAGAAISTPNTNSAYGTITDGEWTHVAATYNGTDIKFYVNGTLTETKNWPGNVSFASSTITIGAFGSNYWTGSLDELAIFDRVLSAEEISSLKTEGVQIPTEATPTGIANNYETEIVNVHPVPAIDQILISNDRINEDSKIIIMNNQGTMVKETQYVKSSPVNISELTAGIYFIQVVSAETKFMAKFIKE